MVVPPGEVSATEVVAGEAEEVAAVEAAAKKGLKAPAAAAAAAENGWRGSTKW